MKLPPFIRRLLMALAGRYDAALSGPITGDPGYRRRFDAAEARLLRLHPGWRVFNPARLPAGRSYPWYMHRCCRAVCRSRRIGHLQGWERSPGSRAEHVLATSLNLHVFYFTPEQKENPE